MMRAALGALVGVATVACGDATGPAVEELPELGPRDAAIDMAVSFDGVDDYASAGTARMPQIEQPQTLMLWVKPEAPLESGNGAPQVLLTLHRSDWSGIVLALDGLAPVAYNVYAERPFAGSETPLTVGTWQHVAFVLERDVSRLYVGGAEVATGDGPLTNRTPILAFIGSLDGYTGLFRGALDELRVYDRAFSTEQIAALAAGQRLEAEPLVLYLPFNEAEGARSYDRSGLGNHAQLGDGVSGLMPTRVASRVPHQ
jgi:hypothetical protein